MDETQTQGDFYMDLHTLKLFQTVARMGSISKAARELNYAQSNITMKMQQLESELKVTLFHRHNRGIMLTSKGKKLFTYTEKIFQLVEETINEVGDNNEPVGSLTIGSMETTAGVRLPQLFAEYLQKYSQVDINLRTGTTEENIQGVLNFKLDGAFVAGPIHHSDLLYVEAFEEELCIITAPTQPEIKSIEDINKKALLLFRSGCSYREILDKWFQKEKMFPSKVMEFGTLDGIIGCVAAGLGISILPQSVITKQIEEGSIKKHQIPEEYAKVKTVFIYRKDKYFTGALKEFIKLL